ncbi:TPM domain-containing protein [Chitinophagaceae bacterium 26-R-25]|nr:TPM domain-containing protein [Chitinophagaceae bacterium 26-R-25]
MKNLLFYLLFLLTGTFCLAQNIPARPTPPRLVNDFANVLTPDQKAALESKLVAYDDSTSNQLVVITLKSIGDYDVQDVALKILRDWGVGNKKTNNGIVLLASMEDHKLRIEVGYGLEGAVPDAIAKRIIENEIVPNFRAGNYYRGFDEATDAIFKAAAGEYKAPEDYDQRGQRQGRGNGSSILSIIVIIIVIIVIFSSRGGGGGGGMMSRRGYRGWGPPIWFPTGGGGWSGGGGGGGWSGGGGGGGFGGFGGGSGGGGGASGSW